MFGILQSIMRNLVRRYVTVEQRKSDNQGVTEDDVNEIKQDISAFRCELIEVLKNSGMNTSTATGVGQGISFGSFRGKLETFSWHSHPLLVSISTGYQPTTATTTLQLFIYFYLIILSFILSLFYIDLFIYWFILYQLFYFHLLLFIYRFISFSFILYQLFYFYLLLFIYRFINYSFILFKSIIIYLSIYSLFIYWIIFLFFFQTVNASSYPSLT